jgi:8-oxo-dGTP pyrophosphatase MutT (NUDIX family)
VNRPLRRRHTARVLVVDDQGRLLLFQDTDLGSGVHMWITAGGAVEPGESETTAAVRELAEETGLVVGEADLVGPVARRKVFHGFSDKVVEQDEVYFGVNVPAFEVDTAGHTPEERLAMTEHRWWTREELLATEHDVWPRCVLDLWDRFESGAAEADLGVHEESTVPVEPV